MAFHHQSPEYLLDRCKTCPLMARLCELYYSVSCLKSDDIIGGPSSAYEIVGSEKRIRSRLDNGHGAHCADAGRPTTPSSAQFHGRPREQRDASHQKGRAHERLETLLGVNFEPGLHAAIGR